MTTAVQLDAEVWTKVRDAFAVALGLEEDEVVPEARLIEDLGAESLDFLDIVFRLERSFDIKIPRGGIEAEARDELEGVYEVDGVLTSEGLAKLTELMPEVPADEFVEGLRVSEIPELFRVETFYNIVTLLLAQKANEEDVSPVAATSQERAVI
jgi:acyl carrier protein